ncbi:MFS transporter [Mycobacterium sp. 155]|uniref:MFS transporter n=1 Tax=Mycobacterium sp. 155 TaxID=1157943 RepID=UPI00037649F2|nr:MFS transporter [Mycobacterium sp. 155]
MTAIDQQHRHRTRSRAAVFSLFGGFGLVIATWAAHLPAIKAATGASASMVGLLLLMLGGGALLGMQLSGVLVDRVGSVPVALCGVTAMAVALIGPLAAHSWALAAIGAVALGTATGVAEVGINAVAVDVEREYRRSIMATFHAVYSVGNVCGAGIAVAGFALGTRTVTTAVFVSAIALILVGNAAVLLRHRPAHDIDTVDGERTDTSTERPAQRGRIVVLCMLAFILMLAEGAGMDWSSLHAQDHLQAGPADGALALGSFVSAMTVGRFSADHVVERIGAVSVVRWGSLAAIVGLTIVMTSPVLALTCVGWALLGLGLSGGMPLAVSAAGNLEGVSGKALSRVVGCGYLAVLAGPGVIGWLADHISLNGALLLPAIALTLCAFAAGAVTRK